ncbi:MAG: hypothetical protein ACI9SE_000656 [Neolewinella sp.]|jgi:hypothetical protein
MTRTQQTHETASSSPAIDPLAAPVENVLPEHVLLRLLHERCMGAGDTVPDIELALQMASAIAASQSLNEPIQECAAIEGRESPLDDDDSHEALDEYLDLAELANELDTPSDTDPNAQPTERSEENTLSNQFDVDAADDAVPEEPVLESVQLEPDANAADGPTTTDVSEPAVEETDEQKLVTMVGEAAVESADLPSEEHAIETVDKPALPMDAAGGDRQFEDAELGALMADLGGSGSEQGADEEQQELKEVFGDPDEGSARIEPTVDEEPPVEPGPVELSDAEQTTDDVVGPVTEAEPDAVLEAAADAEPEAVLEAAADAEPEAVLEAAADAEPDAVLEAAADAEPEAVLEAAADAEPEAVLEAAADAEPDVVLEVAADAEPEAVLEAAADAEPEAVLEAAADAEPEAVLETAADAEPDAVLEAAADAETAPSLEDALAEEQTSAQALDLGAEPAAESPPEATVEPVASTLAEPTAEIPAAGTTPNSTSPTDEEFVLTNNSVDKVQDFLGDLKSALVEMAHRPQQAVDVEPLVEALQAGFERSAEQAAQTSTAVASLSEHMSQFGRNIEGGVAKSIDTIQRNQVTGQASINASEPSFVGGQAKNQAVVLGAISLVVLGWSILFWIKTGSPRLALGTLIGANAIACCLLLSRRGRS